MIDIVRSTRKKWLRSRTIGLQRCTLTSGERLAKTFLRSIRCVFTAREKEGWLQHQRWTTSNHTVVTGSSSGTKRTGSRCVKVVTPRRQLKKMEASEIILNPWGGRGSESLQKWPGDNAPGSFVRNRKNRKGGISRISCAIFKGRKSPENLMNSGM